MLLNIQYFFSLILCLEQTIVSWGEFMEIKVAHANLKEFSLTFTKQINWRRKLLVNIHENFSEFYFTNTDELRSYRAGEMKDQLTRTSYVESCVTLFQRCFNVGHWRCISVVQRWKFNVGCCFIFNVGSTLFQRWSRTLKQRWSDIEMLAVDIYLFKVNNRKTRKRCKICSRSTINTKERRQLRCCGVLIVNFEHISHLFLVFL